MPRALASVFFPQRLRFRGFGGAAAVPCLAHLAALDALASPFLLGGRWEGGDVALSAYALTRPAATVLADVAEMAESGVRASRPIRRAIRRYAAAPRDCAADAAAIQTLLAASLEGLRTIRKGADSASEADPNLPLAAAFLARCLPLFGGSLPATLTAPVALCRLLLQAEDVLSGRARCLSDATAAALDAAKAAPFANPRQKTSFFANAWQTAVEKLKGSKVEKKPVNLSTPQPFTPSTL